MLILENAKDRSSYLVKVSFLDENKLPIVPISLQWSLLDGNEDIINTRDKVVETNLLADMIIVLENADLIYGDTRAKNKRKLVIEAQYISSLTNSVLPLKESILFSIEDIPNV